MTYARYLLIPLALTVAIECGLAWAVNLRLRRKSLVYTVFLCNIITNPALNLIMLVLTYLGAGFWVCAIPLEIAVVAAEAFIINRCTQTKTGQAIWLSLTLNCASIVLGLPVR